jgi:hypothetical protein
MRSTSSKLSAALLAVLLSTGLLAAPAFAMQREGPPRDNPVVRVIKQLMKRLSIITNDEQPGIPHP